MSAEVPSRVDTLKWLYTTTMQAIIEAPADRKSALIGQMRAISLELSELGADVSGEPERNGLLDFQQALAERQSDAKGSRRSSSR